MRYMEGYLDVAKKLTWFYLIEPYTQAEHFFYLILKIGIFDLS